VTSSTKCILHDRPMNACHVCSGSRYRNSYQATVLREPNVSVTLESRVRYRRPGVRRAVVYNVSCALPTAPARAQVGLRAVFCAQQVGSLYIKCI
jgi:hypothetical protein